MPGPAGPVGQQGSPGKRGSAAPPEIIARLSAELVAVQTELSVQFIRIAEIQAELDELHKTLKTPN